MLEKIVPSNLFPHPLGRHSSPSVPTSWYLQHNLPFIFPDQTCLRAAYFVKLIAGSSNHTKSYNHSHPPTSGTSRSSRVAIFRCSCSEVPAPFPARKAGGIPTPTPIATSSTARTTNQRRGAPISSRVPVTPHSQVMCNDDPHTTMSFETYYCVKVQLDLSSFRWSTLTHMPSPSSIAADKALNLCTVEVICTHRGANPISNCEFSVLAVVFGCIHSSTGGKL